MKRLFLSLLASTLAHSVLAQWRPPELLSAGTLPPPSPRAGNRPSVVSGLHGDGRYLVFSSAASDLAAGDRNGTGWDVFRRDLVAGRTERVSDFGGRMPGPWLDSFGGSASDDGTVIAFHGRTPAPGTRDDNRGSDVFIRRMGTEGLEVASMRFDGAATGNGPSGPAQVSGDGRCVVFESLATDLVPGPDTNAAPDIFLRDLQTRTTRRLSGGGADGSPGDRGARGPLIARDAGVVVFRSPSTNLVAAAEESGNPTDLYVWRRATATLQRVVLPGPTIVTNPQVVRVSNPALSADGRHLAFRALEPLAFDTPHPQGPLNGVWYVDLDANLPRQVSHDVDAYPYNGIDDASGPVWSGDGRTLAFEKSVGTITNAPSRIHLWSLAAGLRTLDEARTASDGPSEPERSRGPVVNHDGTLLAFISPGPVPGTSVTQPGPYRLFVRELATGQTTVVAEKASASVAGEGGWDQAFLGFHPDGRRLLFQSDRPLVSAIPDANRGSDIFLGPIGGDELVLLTVATPDPVPPPALSAATPPGRGISADGRHVLLVRSSEDRARRHVYRWDRRTSTDRRVANGLQGAEPNGISLPLALSSDGTKVLFSSLATNLVAGDTNRVEDLFLANLEADSVSLVNARVGDGGFSVRPAIGTPAMSADGRYVVFRSLAPDLVAGTTGFRTNLFLRDIEARQTTWVNRDDPVAGIFDIAGWARLFAISEDGAFVVFTSGRPAAEAYLFSRAGGPLRRLTTGQSPSAVAVSTAAGVAAVVQSEAGGAARLVALHDLAGGPVRGTLPLPDQAQVSSLRFSADGSALILVTTAAFPADRTGVTDDNGLSDVFHYDLRTDRLRLVSIGPDGLPFHTGSDQPDASADGRRVVFRVRADMAATTGFPGESHAYLHDLTTGRTRLLDVTYDGVSPAAGPGAAPQIAADGNLAVFVSSAPDLAAGLGDGVTGVFGVDLRDPAEPGSDADLDGLPDAWETANFGDLAQVGEGDPDADGASNLAEYRAGTDPRAAGSVFRVNVARGLDGRMELRWPTVNGVTYRVEAAERLDPAAFVPREPVLPGTGGFRTWSIDATSATGFYRVRAVGR